MAFKIMNSKFINGINYLNHQQYNGESHGGSQMINRRFQFSKNLYSKDLYAHYGCVNAVEFSNDGEWLVSGGDDKRVLIWNVDRSLSEVYSPKAMKGEHNSNIFCLSFSSSHSKLYSAGNDEQVLLHDVNTGDILDVFLHDEAVYGLSVDPVNESIFASACDDGRVLIWDTRHNSSDTLAIFSSAYHAVMYNPVEPRYIATANAKDWVCLFDIRKPKVPVMKYGSSESEGAMSVRFNSMGTQILALRRRLPPVLYDVTSSHAAAEFDHPEYYNSCTMKSCCFAGDKDQYVLSGSDDFKLYAWKIPDNLHHKKRVWVKNAHFVLKGHRSIVNQVRYNNTFGILASSGVEKIIKLWSPFPISLLDNISSYKDRKVYTHEEYINLVLESGHFMTHDYSHHSVQEDPHMMAFFDSLVQRDIEGWTSDSSDAHNFYSRCFEVQTSDSDDDSSSSDSSLSDNEKCDSDSMGQQQSSSHSLTCLEDKNSNDTEEVEQPQNNDNSEKSAMDRISQLIAQKRKRTRWYSANTNRSKTVSKTNRKRALKLLKPKQNRQSESPEPVAKSKKKPSVSKEDLRETLKSLRKTVCTTKKQKWLQMKLAEIKRDTKLTPSSSDSSASEEELTSIEPVIPEESAVSNKTVISEESVVSDGNVIIEEKALVSNGNVIIEEKTLVSNGNVIIEEKAVVSNGPVITEECDDNLVNNGANQKTCTSIGSLESILPSVSTSCLADNNSNSIVYFPSKNGKHSKRNYRKRSAEEMDE